MKSIGLAEAVESYLAGEPFPVLPWRSHFVSGAFRADVLDAALSLGRDNGKTTLCAGLLARVQREPLALPDPITW